MTLFSPKTELYINGAWVDVSSYVRYASGVEIGRGQADEQGELTPSRLALALKNTDGRFSNRNPGSPYFGLLGRNTPLRQSVTGFPFHLRLDGQGYATTPDAAALDITGDIDIRADIEPDSWTPAARTVIASKYLNTGSNRSWYLSLAGTGHLEFAWSAAGTTVETATSTAAVPATTGRLTVRVVLDVSNAGNHTVTFYTGTSVTTATTQLGAVVTTAGVTSIFSGTAALEVGSGNGGIVIFVGDQRFVGRFYRLQVCNGIAGTVVADPDFTGLADGTTSFSDTYRTWTVVSPGYVTSDGIRFRGEVPTWPPRWDLSGRDVYTPIEAAGITRRLTQGAVPLRSTIFRNLVRYDSSITLAYWTFEDDSQATSAASAVSDGVPATTTGITFAGDDTLPGAAPVATIDGTTSRIFGSVRRTLPTAATGWAVLLYFKLPAIPGSDTTLVRWTSTGTIPTWQIVVGTLTYMLQGFDSLGALVLNLNIGFGAGAEPANRWIAMRAATTLSGGTVTYTLGWHAVGSGTFYGNQDTYSGAPGSPRGWSLSGATALVGASIAHVYVGQNTLPFATSTFAESSDGYQGETAVARLQRLCTEEDIDLHVHSLFGYAPTDTSATMGRQGIDTFVGLLTSCQDADLGILYEPRDRFGYAYWPLDALYNADGVTFSYGTHVAEPFEPTDDDQQLRNAVTATRPGNTVGALAEQETGPLSILPPPDGVGRYEVSYDVNVDTDDELASAAAWLRHLGTYDELRYPAVSFILGNSAFTGDAAATSDVVRLDIGRRFTVDSLPAWLPPDPARALVRGTSETLTTDTWDVTTATTPAGVYDVGVYDATDSRWDSRTTVTHESYASGATTIFFRTEDFGDIWATTGNGTSYDCTCSGEKFTVTAMEPDATFETAGLAGWGTPASGTWARSTAQAHTGTGSGLLTVTGSPTQTYVRQSTQIPVTVGVSYRVTMWAYSVAGSADIGVAIDWFDSGHNYLSTDAQTLTLAAATWTAFGKTAAAPASAAFAVYGPTIGNSPPAGRAIYVDDIYFQQASGSTGYLQAATVTRSINGIAKTLPAASEIHVADAGRWAR